MPEQPDEPPEPPAEDDEEQQDRDPGAYPFIDAGAGGSAAINIRAGWAAADSDEVLETAVDYQGSAGSPAADAAFEAALEWYRDAVSALARKESEDE